MKARGWGLIIIVVFAMVVVAGLYWPSSSLVPVPATVKPTPYPPRTQPIPVNPSMTPTIPEVMTITPTITSTTLPSITPTSITTPPIVPGYIRTYMVHNIGRYFGPVVLVRKTYCPDCDKVETALQEQDIDYWWVNIDTVPANLAPYIYSQINMGYCAGETGVPMMAISSKCYVGDDAIEASKATPPSGF